MYFCIYLSNEWKLVSVDSVGLVPYLSKSIKSTCVLNRMRNYLEGGAIFDIEMIGSSFKTGFTHTIPNGNTIFLMFQINRVNIVKNHFSVRTVF